MRWHCRVVGKTRDRDGAVRRAVAAPHLRRVNWIQAEKRCSADDEIEIVAERGEFRNTGESNSAREILDHRCAATSITPPERPAIRSVIRREVEHVADGGEKKGVAAVRAWIDVAHAHGAEGCAIALPQLASAGCIFRGEVNE